MPSKNTTAIQTACRRVECGRDKSQRRDGYFGTLGECVEWAELDDSFTGSTFQFINQVYVELEDTDTSSDTRRYIDRDREEAHAILMRDYFVEDSKSDEPFFRHRFRMSKRLFLKIVGDIEAKFSYFQEGYDARGKKSCTALQKCTSTIKQPSTGEPPDAYDEYLCMAARTGQESMEYFCDAVINLYQKEFLRRPTSHDVALIKQAHEERHHIPGMLGLDCTHIEWRMCPKHLKGQYTMGDHKSPLFQNERHGSALDSSFSVNGHDYKRGYYLTDGIYPVEQDEKKFKRLQKTARKDVERAFGVLKGK
uniref:uncharacterized protein LOC122604816 n=1 Tax=Erigeron canadensis TaxID=72917 RepID=UPI001CB97157|nr:uncharacterized protein LOC122604816 [Erigeron canadensis]